MFFSKKLPLHEIIYTISSTVEQFSIEDNKTLFDQIKSNFKIIVSKEMVNTEISKSNKQFFSMYSNLKYEIKTKSLLDTRELLIFDISNSNIINNNKESSCEEMPNNYKSTSFFCIGKHLNGDIFIDSTSEKIYTSDDNNMDISSLYEEESSSIYHYCNLSYLVTKYDFGRFRNKKELIDKIKSHYSF